MFSRKRNFRIPDDGINAVESISLGGIKQSILIQGETRNNPVLLFLHGGPSMPVPGVGARASDYVLATTTKELVKHFVVVFWDQRGTGKSYHSDIRKESMNVAQFVSDANELVDWLRKHFDQERIYLVAHSWGTIIGLDLASRHPEKFHAYIGVSQIVNWSENDRLALHWALKEARRRGNRKAIRELEAVGEPPYTESLDQWGVLRKWQFKFNSMVYTNEQIKHPGLVGAAKILLASPDYTLLDVIHSLYHGFKLSYSQRMIEDFAHIDFPKNAPKLEIPVYFIHGRHDVQVHGKLVEDYYNGLETPKGKRLVWMENSSHMLHPDDAKEVERMLIEDVRIS